MNYLLKVTNTYRVGTVQEALALRDQLSQMKTGELTSFSYTTKYIKVKGEIIGEYQICKATITFNDEKEPSEIINAEYNVQ